jgi:DNA-binding NarL/FixJ family response regulator
MGAIWRLNGRGLREKIRRQYPGTAVMVLSQYVEESYATDLLSIHTSAVGYLLKDRVAHVPDFLESLRRVAAGGTVLDPEVVAQPMARRRSDPMDSLTPRDQEVLRLMAEGRSNTGIAEALKVSQARSRSTSATSSPSSACRPPPLSTAGSWPSSGSWARDRPWIPASYAQVPGGG